MNRIEEDKMREAARELFAKNTCTLLRGASHEWASSNSKVLSTPVVNTVDLFKDARFEIGASLVSIEGTSGEALHYHTSHLLGLVVRGAGYLCIPRDSNATEVARIEVNEGDAVVIPRGALHLFECTEDGELDYIALEMSDQPLDYQKHWKPEHTCEY